MAKACVDCGCAISGQGNRILRCRQCRRVDRRCLDCKADLAGALLTVKRCSPCQAQENSKAKLRSSRRRREERKLSPVVEIPRKANDPMYQWCALLHRRHPEVNTMTWRNAFSRGFIPYRIDEEGDMFVRYADVIEHLKWMASEEISNLLKGKHEN